MGNRLKYLERVLQDTAKNERRYIRNVGNGIKLPSASRAIILTVRGVPDSLVLVNDPKRHHDHDVELTDHYGEQPLFHTTNSM